MPEKAHDKPMAKETASLRSSQVTLRASAPNQSIDPYLEINTGLLSTGALLHLQRTAGNRAVQRMLAEGGLKSVIAINTGTPIIQRVEEKKDKIKIYNEVRKKLGSLEISRNKLWEKLVAIAGLNGEALELITFERAVELLTDNLKQEVQTEAPVKGPAFSYTEGMELREPPSLYDNEEKEITGVPQEIKIPGLGVGRIAFYKCVNESSCQGMLAWMSHGLQVSGGMKPVERERSFGFVVGHNENLLRPETPGGFDELIRIFNEKRGNTILREKTIPDMLLGAHDPKTDFTNTPSRQAIGTITAKCDLAILVDFIPYPKIDQQYMTPEMEFLGWTYPPLETVLANLPPILQEYSDMLMLCCRTDLKGKMEGGQGVIPELKKVQAYTTQ